MTDIKPEGLEAARNAIRYLSHPETPWSDEQVAAVINAYLAASPPSPAPAESGAVAESSRQIIHELAADIRDRLSKEEGSANWRNAQRIVELSRPTAPSASMGRVTDEMAEAAFQVMWPEADWDELDCRRAVRAALVASLDSPPDHGGGEGWQKEAAEFKEALNAAPDMDPYDGRRLLMLRGSKLLHALPTQESEDGR